MPVPAPVPATFPRPWSQRAAKPLDSPALPGPAAEINRSRDLSSPSCAFSEKICQILQDRQCPRGELAGGLMRILIVSSKSRCCLALRSTLMVRLSPPSVPSQPELQVRSFAFRPHASESRNNAPVNPSVTGSNVSGQKPE